MFIFFQYTLNEQLILRKKSRAEKSRSVFSKCNRLLIIHILFCYEVPCNSAICHLHGFFRLQQFLC